MREYKYLLGSKMLKLENNRDEDWTVFVNENAKTANNYGYKSIPFFQTIINFFTRGNNIKADPYSALFLYQLSTGFVDDAEYPFGEFNILEHIKVWKEWLKAYMNGKKVEARATKTDILPKQFYHILYQYYMITENVHFISDEAKAKVQKIHDLEMPSEYFYELRDLINSL